MRGRKCRCEHGRGLCGARRAENAVASTGEVAEVLAGPKTPLRARETPSGCLGGIGGGENLRRRRSKLLDDGFGGALGEDEGGDEVGDETASAAEYEDYPGQSDNDGIDVKVVGNSYADAQNLAAFLFTVEFLIHI